MRPAPDCMCMTNDNPSESEQKFLVAALEQGALENPRFREHLLMRGSFQAAFESFPINLEQTKVALERLQSEGISALSFFNSQYPEMLRHIHDPPLVLYMKGEGVAALESPHKIAVVGSRKADQPGCEIARGFSKAIAGAGGCVISGLAFGIDAAAHSGALESSATSSTIAVLGNGLCSGIYPAAHTKLARSILENGGILLSQFPLDSPPYPSNFLNRNRVIAGMSQAVIIIQAARRSGALSTARHAMEEGRDVLVVPGDIHHPLYGGSNELLKQGAHVITSKEDIQNYVPGLKLAGPSISSPVLTPLQCAIVDRLQRGPLHADELRPHNVEISAFTGALFELEEAGLICRMPGNRFMRLTPAT